MSVPLAWLAVERVELVVGPERDPSAATRPGCGQSTPGARPASSCRTGSVHKGHRPGSRTRPCDPRRTLPAPATGRPGGSLTGERHPQREQMALGLHPVQANPHLKVDLGVLTRRMGRRHEPVQRPGPVSRRASCREQPAAGVAPARPRHATRAASAVGRTGCSRRHGRPARQRRPRRRTRWRR
jgi:hypothetical protein